VALNVKAAMMICLGCIGGGSWLLQQTDVRQVEVRSPLVAVDETLRNARSVGDWMRVLPPAESRVNWTNRFARPNPVDNEAELSRTAEQPLSVALTEPQAAPASPVLPPPVEVSAGSVTPWLPVAEASVPVEPEPRAMAAVAEEPAGNGVPVANLKLYQVVKGDTLSKIARRVFESRDPRLVTLLVDLNPKVAAANGRLQIGDELQIPDEPAALAMLAAGREHGMAAGGVPEAAVRTVTATESERWYTIQPNDSLIRIAQRFLEDGGRGPEIVKLNRSLDPHNLRPGVRIKLPPAIRIAQG